MSFERFKTGVPEENYEQTHYDTRRFMGWLFPSALVKRID
jgi:hypothetical protein